MRGLDGRVALVTGGAGMIGSAIGRRLAAEGAAVIVADLAAESAEAVADRIQVDGGTAWGVRLDVIDEQSVDSCFAAAVDRFGALDVLVTTAANMSPEVLANDTDAVDVAPELFDPTMHVNVRGTLFCIGRAVPHLLRRGGGSIVCLSSATAFLGEPNRVLYGASKAAINAVVRHTASRWGRDGIRANAVAPGLVPRSPDVASSVFASDVRSAIRSPRLGRPEDVAGLAAFLASDDAEWINGQVIGVDGGWLLR